ncbi:putative zinc-finger [Longilinea arvoryzae]|uniref:Putative zinc-finger n=1 Tax=Longilinea arvoryzae TaxID=360412 RepID=A0A0S7B9R6_9CHLR|nr:zf-HC2 domain-containing protein [Longilinea arvoryzae]GAP14255.1 putative zinc-finger [Longilinea arvoryzae]
MNHPPFSTWLYEDCQLTPSQAEELKLHLQTCPDCRQQRDAWLNVRHMLRTAKPVEPRPEFARRWQVSLAERRAQKQRRQVRVTILSLSGAVLVLLLGLIAYFLATSSLADLFASVIGTSTQVAVGFMQVSDFINSLLHFLPPALSTAIWFILTSWICLLSFVWVFSIWRITHKGDTSHEEIH